MRAPESVEAKRLCDEGYASLEAGRFDAAQASLLRARTLAPEATLVHFRLALLYVDTARPDAALACLDTALTLEPDNARAHNNRGSALQMLGRMGDAERAFRRALELAPDLDQPYLNLGHLLEKQNQPELAAKLYEQAIARGLDPTSFGHHLAATRGKSTDRAPDRWVRDTFDNFAPTFDARLEALGYVVPRRLAAMLMDRVSGPVDILDLGCGTGQCGRALAPLKGRLTGVDLSEKMLVLARQHGVYDELHSQEIAGWLTGARAASFDLVIAADVFIYIGALETVFLEVSRILRPGGWFAFSTEECVTGDHTLLTTGRYAQAQRYISRLSEAAFAIHVAEPTIIRKESDAALPGRLYLLQRRAAG